MKKLSLPFRTACARCGDEVAAGPLTELGTVSESAGDPWPE